MTTVKTMLKPILVRAGEGPVANIGDHTICPLIGAGQTAGAFLFGEATVEPGGGVPPHIHAREDELFYVLEGRFRVQVGDETFVIERGDTAFAPRHIPHSWYCISPEGGRVLLLVTPGDNFEPFAIEMARRGMVPAEAMAHPESRADFMALTELHGITMLPPAR